MDTKLITRRGPRSMKPYAWLTFSELARVLQLPATSSRWLERKLLDTEWHEKLMIERADARHNRSLPTSPTGHRPWVLSAALVTRFRDELRHFLFG
ncbi:hypothetical protein [Gemmatimonas sp.]|jgi:hypothetical protein|uniref:hypothetical protein n=1 Tax=Gemmatimonas sp. TaxID=1962908 RepID=UPI0037BF9C1D